jgi:hypothetical protein
MPEQDLEEQKKGVERSRGHDASLMWTTSVRPTSEFTFAGLIHSMSLLWSLDHMRPFGLYLPASSSVVRPPGGGSRREQNELLTNNSMGSRQVRRHATLPTRMHLLSSLCSLPLALASYLLALSFSRLTIYLNAGAPLRTSRRVL